MDSSEGLMKPRDPFSEYLPFVACIIRQGNARFQSEVRIKDGSSPPFSEILKTTWSRTEHSLCGENSSEQLECFRTNSGEAEPAEPNPANQISATTIQPHKRLRKLWGSLLLLSNKRLGRLSPYYPLGIKVSYCSDGEFFDLKRPPAKTKLEGPRKPRATEDEPSLWYHGPTLPNSSHQGILASTGRH